MACGEVLLDFVLHSIVFRGFPCRGGPVRSHGNPADEALEVGEAFAKNHDTLGGDFVLADILGMVPAAHFDDDHDLAQLAIDGDIAEANDVIGEERNGVGAERKFSERLIDFNGAENGDADSGKRKDHAVEGLAEVGAEAGREGHFKSGE